MSDHRLPIALFGVHGQIGGALINQLGNEAFAIDRAMADFSNPHSLDRCLASLPPVCAIINAAAYTAVDKAESEASLAETINAEAPSRIAAFAFRKKIPFVHYSTDYVFPGTGTRPYREADDTSPLNQYGASKLKGEKKIIEQAERLSGCYLIFRTSWVYDERGKNFLNTMLRLGAEREQLGIVSDQVGAPSYAADIALSTLEVLVKASAMQPFPSGIYHLTNSGETSWHGFATAIFAQAKLYTNNIIATHINPLLTSEYPTPAKRPHNSRLDTTKLSRTFGVVMPSWEDALTRCMKARFLNV